MAVSAITRNLRHGSLTISDGTTPTPLSVTTPCDVGDLSWTMTNNVIEVLCRGSLDHPLDGDEASVDISTTFKWQQLIAYTEDSSDSPTLYEIIMNVGDAFTTVSPGTYMLKWEFTVIDPDRAAANDEKITFNKVYRTSFELAEGDEFNTIAFTGKDFETAPTIERV